MWERQIGDVGGEMGFAGMRGDLGLASMCGVEMLFSLIDAWGGVVSSLWVDRWCSSDCGWSSDWSGSEGGATFGMRERGWSSVTTELGEY